MLWQISLLSLCLGKICKFPVFSLTGTFLANFPCSGDPEKATLVISPADYEYTYQNTDNMKNALINILFRRLLAENEVQMRDCPPTGICDNNNNDWSILKYDKARTEYIIL